MYVTYNNNIEKSNTEYRKATFNYLIVYAYFSLYEGISSIRPLTNKAKMIRATSTYASLFLLVILALYSLSSPFNTSHNVFVLAQNQSGGLQKQQLQQQQQQQPNINASYVYHNNV